MSAVGPEQRRGGGQPVPEQPRIATNTPIVAEPAKPRNRHPTGSRTTAVEHGGPFINSLPPNIALESIQFTQTVAPSTRTPSGTVNNTSDVRAKPRALNASSSSRALQSVRALRKSRSYSSPISRRAAAPRRLAKTSERLHFIPQPRVTNIRRASLISGPRRRRGSRARPRRRRRRTARRHLPMNRRRATRPRAPGARRRAAAARARARPRRWCQSDARPSAPTPSARAAAGGGGATAAQAAPAAAHVSASHPGGIGSVPVSSSDYATRLLNHAQAKAHACAFHSWCQEWYLSRLAAGLALARAFRGQAALAARRGPRSPSRTARGKGAPRCVPSALVGYPDSRESASVADGGLSEASPCDQAPAGLRASSWIAREWSTPHSRSRNCASFDGARGFWERGAPHLTVMATPLSPDLRRGAPRSVELRCGRPFSSRVWICVVGLVKCAPVSCHAAVLRALNHGAHAVGARRCG